VPADLPADELATVLAPLKNRDKIIGEWIKRYDAKSEAK